MNNKLLKHWFNEEIKRETKNYLKTNENMTYQHLWDAAKTVLRGKFRVIQAYFQKQEKSEINNLTDKGTRKRTGSSLVVQWKGLHAFTARAPSWMPSQGTKTP